MSFFGKPLYYYPKNWWPALSANHQLNIYRALLFTFPSFGRSLLPGLLLRCPLLLLAGTYNLVYLRVGIVRYLARWHIFARRREMRILIIEEDVGTESLQQLVLAQAAKEIGLVDIHTPLAQCLYDTEVRRETA